MNDNADTSSSATSVLRTPIDAVTSVATRVPGSSVVRGAFDGVLNTVGVVSPQARRVAAYAGAGVLAATGVLEWPVAAAGAAVVWLTQPRRKEAKAQETGETTKAEAGAEPPEERPEE